MYKAYNINYLCKILNNWDKSGYKTLEQIKEQEKVYKSNENDNLSENMELLDDWLNDSDDNE